MRSYAGITSIALMADHLIRTDPIHTGEWQSMDTSSSKAHAMYELEDATFHMLVPPYVHALVGMLQPDMPWAEEHFMERVSGIPHNPPPSAARWPYAVRGHADHTDTSGRFDHTYPERFWPKLAGIKSHMLTGPRGVVSSDEHRGIRFNYGDLADVVRLLVRSPLTRQAYLPVWFPEDTGVVDGQRVPCTLGYHFMIRNGRLSCRYFIRSCDMRRHFINDVYFAGRLLQWMCDAFNDSRNPDHDNPMVITPGRLIMHISSLHCFVGDMKEVHRRFIEPTTFRQASQFGIPS